MARLLSVNFQVQLAEWKELYPVRVFLICLSSEGLQPATVLARFP